MPRPNKIVLPDGDLAIPAQYTDHWIQQYRENRWLGLGDTTKIETSNPFSKRTVYDVENPHVFILDLMRRPEYFGFTAKMLFDKTLAPFQMAILRELWIRPFPMLLGCRGMGKCVRGDTLVHTNTGIRRINELVGKATPMTQVSKEGLCVLGENGFRNVSYSWSNGESETRRALTRYGFELEGTLNHPVRVVDDGKIVWKDLAKVEVGDFLVVDRTESWHADVTEFPTDLAYLLGLIVGDGGYTTLGQISFTTADEELLATASEIALRYWGKGFVDIPSSKYSYALYGRAHRKRLFDEYGFTSCVCEHKGFPRCILSANKEACAAFVRGLFDTDGGVSGSVVEFAAKSPEMVRVLQYVLTRFGIVAKRKAKFNKKYQRHYWYLTIQGRDVRFFAERIGFGLKRKQESLALLIEKKSNTNIDVLPHRLVKADILEVLAASRAKRGSGKGKRSGKFSPWHTARYACTYEHLDAILSNANHLSHLESYQRLKSLAERHWRFDEVVEVQKGFCETFDVHVPDGNSFISNGLVSHNSWLLALYCMIRGLFNQGSKIVIVGAAFRQSKVVFDYCQDLWDNGHVFRDIVGLDKKNGPRRDVDRCTLRIGESLIVCLPLGDGQKIRGQRANITIVEEFASVPKQIYEEVVRGFAAVAMSPVEKFQQEMKKVALQELGLWTKAHDLGDEDCLLSNQTILSGTAYYSFNHFYEYWRQYKGIVESRGDIRKLADIFNGKIPDKFNHRDYSVIRVPVNMLPPGFMDQKQIAQAKATVHIGTFMMEYSACFATDSNGFYKRALIEGCVVGKPDTPIEHPSCGRARFHACLKGKPNRSYVMGVDPASEQDNFSIVILECWGEHRRIVYCWTTTRSRYKAKVKRGITNDSEFYGYTARKIRDLMVVFNIHRIALDSQGGGVSVMEALQDTQRLREGERPIYPTIVFEEPKDTDGMAGDHILEMIEFARADWVRDANHGMRKDFEDKALIFPQFDPAIVALAFEDDKTAGRVKVDKTDASVEKLYDTLEDCVMEIEDLKDELATIVHSQTGTSMRDRWDTPETKIAGGKKGRLRKDRYSALLMANMIGRVLQRTPKEQEYKPMGGFAHDLSRDSQANGNGATGPMWIGPSWYTEKVAGMGSYGTVVKRRVQ